MTALLHEWAGGDQEALDKLVQPLYTQLYRLAQRQLAQSHDPLISPGTLVHEAYLRLRRAAPAQCRDRAHFHAMSARLMRFILVDHLRAQTPGNRRVDVETLREIVAGPSNDARINVLDVNEALDELAKRDAEKARIVELRFFAGLTIEETAEATGVSVATVKRHWTFSRAWIRRWLAQRGSPDK